MAAHLRDAHLRRARRGSIRPLMTVGQALDLGDWIAASGKIKAI